MSHPHILTARVERRIVIDENRKGTLECLGQENSQEYLALRERIDLLNRVYFSRHSQVVSGLSVKRADLITEKPDTFSFCPLYRGERQ